MRAPINVANRGKELGSKDIRHFQEHGYILVPGFLDGTSIGELRSGIEEYVRSSQPTQVRWIASHFDTFNGQSVDRHFPALQAMHDGLLQQRLSLLDPALATISERSVGLSVNVMPSNGKFQPHFDRNRLTAVLCANHDYQGGEMLIYPRTRHWLGHPGGWAKRKVQRLLDKHVRRQSYLDAYPSQIRIKPQAGDLLVFEGNRTYHAVMPVIHGSPRISIQFAYDHAGTVFDISDYYGKTTSQSHT